MQQPMQVLETLYTEEDPVILFCNGSFDPITCAHIALVERIHDWFLHRGTTVTRILFSPVHECYPHKRLTSSLHRIKMICLAIRSSKLASIMSVDTMEAEDQRGYQPTFIAVERIIKHYGVGRIYIAAGMDLLKSQCNPQVWLPVNVKKLYSMASLVVLPRNAGAGSVDQKDVLQEVQSIPYLREAYDGGRILILEDAVSSFSSSQARAELAVGSTAICTSLVNEYISKHGLYT